MNDNHHVSKADFLLFQQNLMNQKEKERFLQHVCSCNYCSDQLAIIMSEEIITAPRDLKENILRATKRPEVQLAVKVKETSKQMQLFLYSLKVGTATIGALLLLLLTMNMPDLSNAADLWENGSLRTEANQFTEENNSITDSMRNGANIISNYMLDFSNNIMKTEVTKNDQKER